MSSDKTTLRILLIEDDESDALMTRTLLEEAIGPPVEVEWINTANAGMVALRKLRHDVALVDERLGSHCGLAFIRQAHGESINTPLILLTRQTSQDFELKAVEVGAADYLVKGLVDTPSLIRSLRYAIDRSKAIDTLSSDKNDYRVMFESNPLPMILTDLETGTIASMNDAALEMYGGHQWDFNHLTLPDLRSANSELSLEPGTRHPAPGACLRSLALR